MSANSILIVGESGSGKSTSVENLPPDQTYIINVSGKKLPFKGWRKKYTHSSSENPKGNMFTTDSAQTIVSLLKKISAEMPHVKYVVIDDSQYVAVNEYMMRANEKGFDKFTSISQNMFRIPIAAQSMRDDMFVFFLSHMETIQDADGNMKTKAKTIGKMMDNTVTYEGLFSIVLFTYKAETKEKDVEYGFITNGDPRSTAKSPKGMFVEKKIPNDLMNVVEAIRKYEEDEE